MQPLKIHIELVPQTCWFSNVRSQVKASDWDLLRKQAYADANHKCEVCGRKGRLEAHEIWHYDDQNLVQKLHKITAICKSCHELYHFGFAELRGKGEKSTFYLAKLHGWSIEQTKEYISIVYEIWYQRSKKNWDLDLTFLDKKGIPYKTISKETRSDFAKNKLKE